MEILNPQMTRIAAEAGRALGTGLDGPLPALGSHGEAKYLLAVRDSHGRPGLTVLSLLAFLVALVAAPPVVAAEGELEPAARVNGVVINRETVRDLVKSIITDESQPPSSDEIGRLFQHALDSLIDLELLHQEAEARGLRVSDAEVDAEIQRSRARFADAATFDAALERSGLTQAQLRADTRKTLLASRLLEQVVGKNVTVSDAEARKFYDDNPAAFTNEGRVHVRYLLLRAPPAAGPERTKSKEKAEALRQQIAGGASFDALARRNSEDGSAQKGGDLGFLDPGTLPPDVEAAALRLRAGEVSAVIETANGFHLVQVVERHGAGVVPFEKMREGIVQTLAEEEKQRRQQAFVDELRKKAKIEIVEGAGS
jgi:peptidyl-prolyl cis-trans isomerase C